jgi:hypothetical protein
MWNRIILGLAGAAALAFAIAAYTACGNTGTQNNPTQDLAGGSTDGGGGDGGVSCFSGTPMTNEDFLNACTTPDGVDITPFYPTNAPNGVLPTL